VHPVVLARLKPLVTYPDVALYARTLGRLDLERLGNQQPACFLRAFPSSHPAEPPPLPVWCAFC
jgi:hypothetical protein